MNTAIFTRGPLLRHILLMTAANTFSILALVASDLLDLYFLSQLGHQELAAAIGFSGILLFFLVSLGLGLQIAMGALVARAEGQHQRAEAKRLCSHVMAVSVWVTIAVTVPAWWYLQSLLEALGAKGETLAFAVQYCTLVLPATPLLVAGMCAAAALRALGDVRRSVLATVAAAITTMVFDPLLILGLDLGIEGAALAAFLSRLMLVVVAVGMLVRHHRFLVPVRWAALCADSRAIMVIAGPALLTTLATPIGSSYVLKTMAQYGDSAVAGAAIVGRVVPVALAVIFGLSMSIGPIIGQNAGADRYDRVRQTLSLAAKINTLFVLLVWLLLFLLQGWVIRLFAAEAVAAELITFYLSWLLGTFVFAGLFVIALAGFNNLNLAAYATALNIARVVLGLLPLVAWGSAQWGASGILLGEALASVVWGAVAYWLLLRRVALMAQCHAVLGTKPAVSGAISNMAYSSGLSQLGSVLSPVPELEAKPDTEPTVEPTSNTNTQAPVAEPPKTL